MKRTCPFQNLLVDLGTTPEAVRKVHQIARRDHTWCKDELSKRYLSVTMSGEGPVVGTNRN